MKHVFFVHSHITYLVSRGVIRERGLAPADVLFVCARGYPPPADGYQWVDFPERRWVLTWRLGQWFAQKRELAQFIDRVAGGRDFAWYLPHTAVSYFHAFIGHPLCRGFHLIEEGMGAYFTAEAIGPVLRQLVSSRPGWRGWVLRLWVRLRPPVFADPRYLTAWGCTDDAFPGYPRRRKVEIAGVLPAAAESIETVVVFDGALETHIATPEAFFRCVQDLVEQLSRDGRSTVFYKLHPVQYRDTRYTPRLRQLLDANTHGVRFVELAPDFCLEALAAAGQACFYVFLSSVAIYAAEGGCRVYSMSDRLAALDPTYRAAAKDLPEPVRKRMVFL